MNFLPGDHAFVDESKAGGYYVAVAAAARGAVAPMEKHLRSLRIGGRSAIHFNSEGNRRDALLREFCALDIRVTVYIMRGVKDRVARPALLRELVDDLVRANAASLLLERDDSLEREDRRIIRQSLTEHGALGSLSYGHARASEHPLLWIADAVAWCYQKGEDWPGKVSPIVTRVERMIP